MARVDQQHLEAARLEDLKERDPIDAGGFHGDGGDATGVEPVAQHKEILGEGGKGAHRTGIGVRWNGHVNLAGTNIDAGGVGMEGGQLWGGFCF